MTSVDEIGACVHTNTTVPKSVDANCAAERTSCEASEVPRESPPDTSSHKFVVPTRQILNAMDMVKWTRSSAYRDFLGFIQTLNESVKSQPMSINCNVSDTCTALILILDSLQDLIKKFPPVDQPQRFGNKAFKSWYEAMKESIPTLISEILPESQKGASVELVAYLHDSFGNATRIDYGTGHEACFVAFLCCLYKLRVLTGHDDVAIVNKVFARYLDLMRELQKEYRMEPAGSHGVWGLDDFQFIPFIWGSSQLVANSQISPESIPELACATANKNDYMFFDCLACIHRTKTGLFAEHSNTLWGISSVPHWTKVNSGLLKMYKAEVLAKFPVMQHFVFGSLLSIGPPS